MSTGIQWTDETWNPVVGCNQVSPGCDHCYAKTLHDMRHKAVLGGKKLAPQYAKPFERVQLMQERMNQPISWQRPRRVFVNSVSDLFHNDVPDFFLDEVFAVMALAPQHTFQVLTKRAGRMRSYMTSPNRKAAIAERAMAVSNDLARRARTHKARISLDHFSACFAGDGPFANVWLGVSVENRAAASRIGALRQTPAAIRFISFEPLLEAVEPDLTGIDWAIIGGESGKNARPFDLHWASSIVDRCRFSGAAPFVKQIGHVPTVGGNPYTVRDSHGGDPDEWPAYLRVREFPAVRA